MTEDGRKVYWSHDLQRKRLVGDEFRRIGLDVNRIESHVKSLWQVEDMFISLLRAQTRQIGPEILFFQDARDAHPRGYATFRLGVSTDHNPAVIGLGDLEEKEVRFPVSVAELANPSYPRLLPEEIATLDTSTIPFLIDLFSEQGFKVVQRDQLFVPDDIYEKRRANGEGGRYKVVSERNDFF